MQGHYCLQLNSLNEDPLGGVLLGQCHCMTLLHQLFTGEGEIGVRAVTEADPIGGIHFQALPGDGHGVDLTVRSEHCCQALARVGIVIL